MPSTKQVQAMAALARRWVVDYFNCHNGRVCTEFVRPDYALHIGDYVFAGRDTQWLPAVQKQMDQFPGLGMTVHQVLANESRAAVYFTQHGASGGAGGPVTCWSGVAIYRGDGEWLSGCVAQEDYMTRQRQLKSGRPDTIAAPAPAPWDVQFVPADPDAELAVRAWLQGAWPCEHPDVLCDDEHITGATPLAFDVQECEFSELYSVGSEVVFHVRQKGRYLGGFAGVAQGPHAAFLHCNGMVRVHNGKVVAGRVIRDRTGLRANLPKA